LSNLVTKANLISYDGLTVGTLLKQKQNDQQLNSCFEFALCY